MTKRIPLASECRLIRHYALRESRQNGNAAASVHIEAGIRHNTEHDRGRSMNIALVTDHPDWDDTDLFDFASWSDFRRGFDITPDGRAVIDFYLYAPAFGDHGDLCCNLQAIYDADGLARIEADGALRWARGI